MKAKAKLRVNDLVNVVRDDGSRDAQLYLLEWMGQRGYCVIREAGNPLAGGKDFDTSMLVKVPR